MNRLNRLHGVSPVWCLCLTSAILHLKKICLRKQEIHGNYSRFFAAASLSLLIYGFPESRILWAKRKPLRRLKFGRIIELRWWDASGSYREHVQ